MSAPVALVVRVEVKPESIDTFLKSIEHNAINSRKEPGCLQFGTLVSNASRLDPGHVVMHNQ